MAGKITYFKTEDFEQRGEFNQSHSECKLNDLVFIKGETLKHDEIKQVLDTCNKYTGFDINTLIIKGEEDLTIWIEQKAQSQGVKNQSIQRSPSPQAMPTKVVTKRYRGQVYEETVIDWAAVQQMSAVEKPRRKYRGNYID